MEKKNTEMYGKKNSNLQTWTIYVAIECSFSMQTGQAPELN